MILRGEKCNLRPLTRADIPRLVEMVNNPEVRRYLSIVFPLNDVTEEKRLQNMYQGPAPTRVMFGIDVDGKLVGTVELASINWTSRHATFAIAIMDPEYWNRGIGTEATRLILDYAFLWLNLHRVGLEVYEYNERAIHVYKKIGFVEEGRLRKQRYLEGKYYDVIVMGILREEWLERRQYGQNS